MPRYFSQLPEEPVSELPVFSLTGRMLRRLSTTGFTGMTAAALPFYYFSEIVAKHEIQFSVKRHRDCHIGEESSPDWHCLLPPWFHITTLP
jgi:hypothetical protein